MRLVIILVSGQSEPMNMLLIKPARVNAPQHTHFLKRHTHTHQQRLLTMFYFCISSWMTASDSIRSRWGLCESSSARDRPESWLTSEHQIGGLGQSDPTHHNKPIAWRQACLDMGPSLQSPVKLAAQEFDVKPSVSRSTQRNITELSES